MNKQTQDFTDALLGTQDAKLAPEKEQHPHCYVCGVEVDEDDIIEGPEIPLCFDCFIKWQDRCYQQLEEMKEEANKKLKNVIGGLSDESTR